MKPEFAVDEWLQAEGLLPGHFLRPALERLADTVQRRNRRWHFRELLRRVDCQAYHPYYVLVQDWSQGALVLWLSPMYDSFWKDSQELLKLRYRARYEQVRRRQSQQGPAVADHGVPLTLKEVVTLIREREYTDRASSAILNLAALLEQNDE